MDISTILSLLSGGNTNLGGNSAQNPAYFGYPKEAYNGQNINLESILQLLASNKGGLTSILSNFSGKNSPLSSIASILSKKKEEDKPLPNKEILL